MTIGNYFYCFFIAAVIAGMWIHIKHATDLKSKIIKSVSLLLMVLFGLAMHLSYEFDYSIMATVFVVLAIIWGIIYIFYSKKLKSNKE